MSFIPVHILLKEAETGEYAVGAFNCHNMEFIQAVVAAAEAEKAPVIIQASQGALKYGGINYIVALARAAAEEARVPVALHLDHGTSFTQVMQCLRAGFSSVMFDGSKLSLNDNINITREIVKIARPLNVSVEAELGKIGGAEDKNIVLEQEALFTDPAQAQYFVQSTEVDSLAVAIGNVHGHYKGRPALDFARLQKISSLVRIPIVLHGSSGLPDEAIKQAIRLGVRKVNIDTDIRDAFLSMVRQTLLQHPAENDPRQILGPARKAAQEVIQKKIRLFGSAGKVKI
ncbi:MAG TPA: fructose-1,6-bisphosphate aldolase, class II [Desulfotomaculum sp.]|nr:fructose-1,6-bisphosphate aldolase, class II [Desulfotomaculum sp.]